MENSAEFDAIGESPADWQMHCFTAFYYSFL
jgi:hypothetical protein